MTVNNCLLFNLSDINNIQFECKSCHSRYVVPIGEWRALPMVCGNCKERYCGPDSALQQSLVALQAGLQDLLKEDSDRKLVVRFEVKTSGDARVLGGKD